MDEEKFMELALELGADDVAIEEDVYEIYTAMEDFISVQEELERRGIPLAAKRARDGAPRPPSTCRATR